MTRRAWRTGCVLWVLGCVPGAAQGTPRSAEPTLGQRLAADLTWSAAERETRFAHMDRMFSSNVVRAGGPVRVLPQGRPLDVLVEGLGLRAAMRRDRLAGVLVLQHGAVRVEAYGLGATDGTRWTSFSVAKSMTSTLVGVAVRRGAIGSVEDEVTRYVPELRGSAYDGVTVRQLLTMTTGVRWVEDYTAPDSDNVQLYAKPVAAGADAVVEYMRRLPRAHAPGTVWNYDTGEADLAGVVVRRAMARQASGARQGTPSVSLSAVLSAAVWRPFGMERGATWIADGGREFGGSGVSATLRDYGRFGLFALQGGGDALPAGWFAEATRPAAGSVVDGRGYGMGWWTYPDGSYAALGIFGQSILVDPRRDVVIVMLGAWPQATGATLAASRQRVWLAVKEALDARAAPECPRRLTRIGIF